MNKIMFVESLNLTGQCPFYLIVSIYISMSRDFITRILEFRYSSSIFIYEEIL